MRIQNLLLASGIVLLSFVMAGCNEETAVAEEDTEVVTIAANNTKVFKYSGVIQCELDSGTPVEDMQMELVNASVDVICSQRGGDGKFYPALCGTESGFINVYEIRSANLVDAQALGFASVAMLSDYNDQVCE